MKWGGRGESYIEHVIAQIGNTNLNLLSKNTAISKNRQKNDFS